MTFIFQFQKEFKNKIGSPLNHFRYTYHHGTQTNRIKDFLGRNAQFFYAVLVAIHALLATVHSANAQT